MTDDLAQSRQTYADLLVAVGVNLQPGQCLRLSAELEHRDFARLVTAAAYRAGAAFVQTDWIDSPSQLARFEHSRPEHLSFFPRHEVARHQEFLDDGWARLSLVGPEFPHIFDAVDPAVMRTVRQTRAEKLKFYFDAVMASQIQWCVAAVPTQAWASQVFGGLSGDAALERLWRTILSACRVDLPDPPAAWRAHSDMLSSIGAALDGQQVRSLHFHDPTPGPDGRPSTDLTIGLTERSIWVGGGAVTQKGVHFMPNIPTEELFTTPDNRQAEGWVRTSKPTFPFERRVDDAWFRFAAGELVEHRAAVGQEALDEFFQIEGTRRLGEVALVDSRSPINRAGVVFYEILFDENAACHIAFGEAYLGCVADSAGLDEASLAGMGVNKARDHLDFMIGTATMDVTGVAADGREVSIMRQGRFAPALTGEETP